MAEANGTNGARGGYALEVSNLSYSYTSKEQVLANVSLKVPRGRITSILGANGSGKSTLLHLMARQIKLQTGTIAIDGSNIPSFSMKEFARQVGLVHQANAITGSITVKKLVSYGRTPYREFMRRMSEEDERCIEWALEVTQTKTLRDKQVIELSGGQRQRVWIAMALAQDTSILLLDEPTTWLDIAHQVQLLKLVRNINLEFGKTIIMVLHDINQALAYSDEVVALNQGRIVAQGAPQEVVSPELIEQLYGIRLELATINNRHFVLQA